MAEYIIGFCFAAYIIWRLSLRHITVRYSGTYQNPPEDIFEILVRPGPEYWDRFQIKSLTTDGDGSMRIDYKSPELGVQTFIFEELEEPYRARMVGSPETPSTVAIGRSLIDLTIEPVSETTSRLRFEYVIEFVGSFRWSFGKILPAVIYEVQYENLFEKAGLKRIVTPQDMRDRRWRLAKLFLLSLVLMSLLLNVWLAVSLMLVVLVHEWGHIAAMRAFGDRMAQMTFVPLFGGLAVGGDRTLSDFKRAIIVLAGPVIGCSLAVVTLGLWWLTQDPFYLAVTETVGFINLINLAPLYPLDGGVLTGLLVRPLGPRVGKAVMVAGGAMIAVGHGWLAWDTGSPVLWVLAGLFAWVTVLAAKVAAAPHQTRALSLMEGVAILTGFVFAVGLAYGVMTYPNQIAAEVFGDDVSLAGLYTEGPAVLEPLWRLFQGPASSLAP